MYILEYPLPYLFTTNKTNFRLDKAALETAINASIQIDNFTDRRGSLIDFLYNIYSNKSIKIQKF